MKKLILVLSVLFTVSACSRPETPPPTTPIQPPTVESTNTIPNPVIEITPKIKGE